MEHHSNIVPWQLLAQRTGARLKYIPVTGDDGRLDLDQLDKLLEGARVLSFTHISNALGTINPVAEICAKARTAGVITVVDAAQSAGHLSLDVRALGCDFLALSSHKLCGPTGIGVLFARSELQEAMPPYQGGGEMISKVGFFESEYNVPPHKFEAGTPNISGVVGFGEAVQFLNDVGLDTLAVHENSLKKYALERLTAVEGLTLYGPREERTSVFSFTYGDIHPHDLSTILDQNGIAIRAGHHCNQPLMDHFGISATARASFYLYNTHNEVDALCEGLQMAAKVFGGIA